MVLPTIGAIGGYDDGELVGAMLEELGAQGNGMRGRQGDAGDQRFLMAE